MATKRADRCWPGYEPVPGKKEHEQGSCRPKAESKLTPKEEKVRTARKKELDEWKKTHPKSPRKAAQHLKSNAPKAAKKTATKGARAKRTV